MSADQTEVFDKARTVTCPSCGAKPGVPCIGPLGDAGAGFTHGARLLEAGALPEPDPRIFARVLEARRRPEETAAELYDAARRRLLEDPVLSARVKLALQVIDVQVAWARHLAGPSRQHATDAAAIALLIAERPELLTGEPPSGEPPAEVIARVIAPALPMVPVQELTRVVLNALELAGYEVTRRADRFASLERDAAQLRISTRGSCGLCRDEVIRGVSSGRGELLLGPWQHIEPGVLHEPVDVVTS